MVLDGFFHGGANSAALHTRGGVVHQVDGDEGRSLARLLGDPVRPRELLLTGENFLAVYGLEVVVKGLGVGIGGWVDGVWVDVMSRARGRGRQSDGIYEIPGVKSV